MVGLSFPDVGPSDHMMSVLENIVGQCEVACFTLPGISMSRFPKIYAIR
jgi:hypothetical protein